MEGGFSAVANRERVLEFLRQSSGRWCDDCISGNTGIEPRQQVHQICRTLADRGAISRIQGPCTGCGKIKLVSCIRNVELARPVVYFEHPGEVNTEDVLRHGRARAEQLGLRVVVVPTDSGRSALRAVRIFKDSGIRLIVVTTPPCTTWGPRGDLPSGIPDVAVREALRSAGAELVQGTMPFSGLGSGRRPAIAWQQDLVQRVLEVFGAGTKIAIQVALMAVDAGLVPEGEDVLAFGGTYKGLDSALVVRTCLSWHFLDRFEVLEVVAKPRRPRVTLPEYEDPHWRGDVDAYYGAMDVGALLRGE